MINKPCETGIYQVRGSPDKFYQCTKGIKHHEQSCPAGLLFNEAEGICDWADNVEVLPAETASSCYDGLHGLSYPYSYWYPDWYYYCYDNIRYYDRCPGGLTFDSNAKKCVWPSEIMAIVGDLEISSETIKDVKEIQSFFSCFWNCGGWDWDWWYGWHRKSLSQKYRCSNRCLRRASRNRRETETCEDGFEMNFRLSVAREPSYQHNHAQRESDLIWIKNCAYHSINGLTTFKRQSQFTTEAVY